MDISGFDYLFSDKLVAKISIASAMLKAGHDFSSLTSILQTLYFLLFATNCFKCSNKRGYRYWQHDNELLHRSKLVRHRPMVITAKIIKYF